MISIRVFLFLYGNGIYQNISQKNALIHTEIFRVLNKDCVHLCITK